MFYILMRWVVSKRSLHNKTTKTYAKFPGVEIECKTLGTNPFPNPHLSFGDRRRFKQTTCNYKPVKLEFNRGIVRPKTLPASAGFLLLGANKNG